MAYLPMLNIMAVMKNYDLNVHLMGNTTTRTNKWQYLLALEFPAVELVPVYLDNLHRALPKGSLLPVPMVCTVRFGAPLARLDGESREAFLARARAAVMTLGGLVDA